MAKIIEPRILAGFRDFLPEQMIIRKKVMAIFIAIFEKYGFEPLETPTLEFQDVLLGKYGEEAEKLMYLFTDPGQRAVGLKYDLTVPLARVASQYTQIPKPFKRYQIQPVWRADKPQKGRYREITQCDIDTVGISSPLADAEIVAVIFESLKAVGFKAFTVRINSRQSLFKIMEASGVDQANYLNIIQSIDKLDKKTEEEVKSELSQKGLSIKIIKEIFTNLRAATPDKNLTEVINLIDKLGVDKNFYKYDPILARGLDYYTGPIFETVVTEPKIGSVTGGGRYDELLSMFTGLPMPATGTTIGLDRTVDVITDLNLWPDIQKTASRVLVTIFNPDLLRNSLEITSLLRQSGVNSEIYLDPIAKLDKQLKYADNKGIPFAVIIGPDEAAKNLITIKDLRTKTQATMKSEDAIANLLHDKKN